MKRWCVALLSGLLAACANVPLTSISTAEKSPEIDTTDTALAVMTRLAQQRGKASMPQIEKLSKETTPICEDEVESTAYKRTDDASTQSTPNPVKKTTPSKYDLVTATANLSDEQDDASASGVYPLVDGVEAFAVRNALIKNAQKTLDLQYYSLQRGLSTRILIRELVFAANRGVRIRILLDDMETLGRDQEMSLLNAHANIEVRVFNPIRRWRGTRITRALMFVGHLPTMHRRMHNKLWLADGVLGITGGRNLGDRYFNASEHDNFSDLDVLLSGQVIEPMKQMFNDYWQSSNTLPISQFAKGPTELSQNALKNLILKTNKLTKKERVQHHPYLTALIQAESHILPDVLPNMLWGQVEFVSDADDKINHKPISTQLALPNQTSSHTDTPVFNALVNEITRTQKELILVSPYFVPGTEFTNLLIDLVKQGRQVTVITNSLESTDVPLVNGSYEPYRQRLLEGGINLYELRGFPNAGKSPQWRHPIFSWKGSRAALHSKAAIIDGQVSFVTSMNIDPRSVIWNTELGLTIRQSQFAQRLRKDLLTATDPRYSYHVKLNKNGKPEWQSSSLEAGSENLRTHIRTRESGNLWRCLQKWIGRHIVPERYL
ncbi:phospholipase D family protein [Formosimonas limnophila]|uniref:Phospholipase D family protein n=1 Tax=Formosimonas limnophila TaxID=1384487 RepID=A0A8J3CN84_9BURK|nr:phospholipase D family protein [Formosimonas limnophila]GHA74546.1 phospholipase D family protein [Formosimonas limnophila]